MPAEERVNYDSVIVVAGGGAAPSHATLPTGAPVVAADEGLDSALEARQLTSRRNAISSRLANFCPNFCPSQLT